MAGNILSFRVGLCYRFVWLTITEPGTVQEGVLLPVSSTVSCVSD